MRETDTPQADALTSIAASAECAERATAVDWAEAFEAAERRLGADAERDALTDFAVELIAVYLIVNAPTPAEYPGAEA